MSNAQQPITNGNDENRGGSSAPRLSRLQMMQLMRRTARSTPTTFVRRFATSRARKISTGWVSCSATRSTRTAFTF